MAGEMVVSKEVLRLAHRRRLNEIRTAHNPLLPWRPDNQATARSAPSYSSESINTWASIPRYLKNAGCAWVQRYGDFAFGRRKYRADHTVRVTSDKGHGLSSGLMEGPTQFKF